MDIYTTTLKRDNSIDLMKGIITFLMMISHSLSFTGIGLHDFINYVNLTTFSSFMFCFGYVCNIAYLQKQTLPWNKMLFGAIKVLGAYYVSALMYSALVLKDFSNNHLFNLLTQKWIAGCSEFLISWAYLYVLMIVSAPLLKLAAKNKYVCICLIVMSLTFTFVDYEKLTISWLGPIIGCNSGCYFPLIPYFSYFLIGSYLSQNKIIVSKLLLTLSFLFSSLCYIYILKTSTMPQRWGPSLLWVVGSYFWTYIYYIGTKTIKFPARLSRYLISIGKKTLLFLLVNNLFCFLNSFLNINSLSYKVKFVAILITLGGSILLPWMKLEMVSKPNQS